MATVSIGSGRGTASIQLFFDQVSTTMNENWTGLLFNDVMLSTASLPNITITSGIVKLSCASGHGFKDHTSATSNPLRPDQSKGVMITGGAGGNGGVLYAVDSITYKGLQVKQTGGNFDAYSAPIGQGTGKALVHDCILENACSTGTLRNAGLMVDGTGAIEAFNTVVYVQSNATVSIVSAIYNTGTVSANFCTFISPNDQFSTRQAIVGLHAATNIENCYFAGWVSCAGGTHTVTGNNNATDKASAWFPSGTGHVYGASVVDQFVSSSYTSFPSQFDVKLASGTVSIANAGFDNNSGFEDNDIVGQSRTGTGRWDIGAHTFYTLAGGGGGGSEGGGAYYYFVTGMR